MFEPPSFNKNIIETISGNDNLSILTTLLDASGLDAVLAGKGPLTLFAPSNAFDFLPPGAMELLLLDENRDVLTKILEYHVMAKNGVSSSLTDGSTMTLSGDALSISVDENTVDDATVVVADVIASNGIVHIIDSILLPPGISISDLVVSTQEDEDEEQNKPNEVVEDEDQSQTTLAESDAEETGSSEVVGNDDTAESAAAPVATADTVASSDTVATSDVSGSRRNELCLLAFGLAFLV